jgi:hypothetical protein
MAIHLKGVWAIVFLFGLPLALGITATVLLDSTMWGVTTSISILVLMFAVAALPIKRKATREDVAKSIEDFVNGAGGPWDWDDFVSCRIADEELETIRIKCLRTQSEYPGGPNRWCNEQGIDVLRGLARQLRGE